MSLQATMDNNRKFIEALKFLSQTSRILNQPLQLGDLISIILEESIKLSEADLVCLILLDKKDNPENLYLMTSGSKRKLKFEQDEISLDHAGDYDAAVATPIAGDDRFNVFFRKHLDREYKCRLRIPIFFRNRWSGYIDHYSNECSKFEVQNLIDFLKALTDSFAIALDNAELAELAYKKTLENKLLIETSLILSNKLEQDEVLNAIADSLKRLVDYDGLIIYLLREDHHLKPIFWRGYEDSVGAEHLINGSTEGLVGWTARTGQGAVVDDVSKDDRYVQAREKTRSEMVVPIKLKDRVIGVFNIESDQPGTYHEHDLDLLMTFAAKSAIAIERSSLYRELLLKKQLDQEVDIARSIQKTFLPRKDPEIKGFDVSGLNRSSRQVGGDYYDFIDIEEGQTGVVIADVAGKGVPASLIMASFRASLIAEIRNNYAIRAIMQKVNKLMTESLDKGNFVTAVYGVLDSRNRILTYSNAGHNPPLLFRKSGEVQELTYGGLAFGIKDDVRYSEQPLHLDPGDSLVMFTDGVTEAQNDKSEDFDNSRLIDIFRKNETKSAREIVEAITSEVLKFKAEDFILDDLTLMVLKSV